MILSTSYLLFQPTTKMFINGQFVESKTNKWIDLHDPVSSSLYDDRIMVYTRRLLRRFVNNFTMTDLTFDMKYSLWPHT